MRINTKGNASYPSSTCKCILTHLLQILFKKIMTKVEIAHTDQNILFAKMFITRFNNHILIHNEVAHARHFKFKLVFFT